MELDKKDIQLLEILEKNAKSPVLRLTGHQQLVNHISFSPDGRYFASASFDKKVKVYAGHLRCHFLDFFGRSVL